MLESHLLSTKMDLFYRLASSLSFRKYFENSLEVSYSLIFDKCRLLESKGRHIFIYK